MSNGDLNQRSCIATGQEVFGRGEQQEGVKDQVRQERAQGALPGR